MGGKEGGRDKFGKIDIACSRLKMSKIDTVSKKHLEQEL